MVEGGVHCGYSGVKRNFGSYHFLGTPPPRGVLFRKCIGTSTLRANAWPGLGEYETEPLGFRRFSPLGFREFGPLFT